MGRSPRRLGSVRVVGLLLVCVVVFAGCTSGGRGLLEPPPRDTAPPGTAAPSTAPPPDSGPGGTGGTGAGPAPGTMEELRADVETAVRTTDQFWSRHWREFFTGTYRPPVVHGYYDGNDPAAGPFCGPQPPVPLNAFYCPAEDLIAWDVNLMTMLFAEGDASVYLVIAHEWGHAIQQRMSEVLVTQDAELQADCLAGASLYGSARDGTLLFEQGDEEELARILAALSDRTPWTDVGDHGSASERIRAFARGGQGGVPACLPGS